MVELSDTLGVGAGGLLTCNMYNYHKHSKFNSQKNNCLCSIAQN